MTKLLIVVLALLAQLRIACEADSAAAPTKLIIAHAANNPRVAPLWVTDEQGFFAKYGIKAEVIFIRNSALSIAALYSRSIDISQAGGISVLGVGDKGPDLKIIAAFTSKLTHDLVVRPGINSPRDLRGKRVGVQVVGGSLWITAMLALEQLKIDPTRDDIRVLTIGDQIVLAQALETGIIDAAPLDTAFSQKLKKKGFPVLVLCPIISLTYIYDASYVMRHENSLSHRIVSGRTCGVEHLDSRKNFAVAIDSTCANCRDGSAGYPKPGHCAGVVGFQTDSPAVEGTISCPSFGRIEQRCPTARAYPKYPREKSSGSRAGHSAHDTARSHSLE
jgi:hypothetical protein